MSAIHLVNQLIAEQGSEFSTTVKVAHVTGLGEAEVVDESTASVRWNFQAESRAWGVRLDLPQITQVSYRLYAKNLNTGHERVVEGGSDQPGWRVSVVAGHAKIPGNLAPREVALNLITRHATVEF